MQSRHKHTPGRLDQKWLRARESRGDRPAAREYDFDFRYKSRPSWDVYASLLEFAELVRRDLRDLRPRDMIDIQSFMWVQGSDEYEE